MEGDSEVMLCSDVEEALREYSHGVVQPKTFPMLRICVAMSAPFSVSSYLLHPGERRHELILVMHYYEGVVSFIAKSIIGVLFL